MVFPHCVKESSEKSGAVQIELDTMKRKKLNEE
jgi:hypothetical protein